MTRRAGVAFAFALFLAAATAVVARTGENERFPHEKHARLFPLCVGCHAGIEDGNPAEAFPDPSTCASCHDGVRAQPVDWTGPASRVSNLRFDHPEHDAEMAAEGESLVCGACHTPVGAERMEVERTLPDRCFACHAHEARDHFVDARCTTCHVPLAETRFTLARMEALPEPATHDAPGFLAGGHGRLAAAGIETCATCHVRDQCAGCHVDATRVAEIGALAAAPAGMRVPPLPPAYPLPPSHLDPAWIEAHGAVASAASCGACHTRESCATCHDPRIARSPMARIADLPSRADVVAPGVATTRRAPASHASPFFATQHATAAATRPESCASCHTQARFCEGCHLSGVAAAPARVRPATSGGASAGSTAALLSAVARLDPPLPASYAAADTPVAQPPAASPGRPQRPRPAAAFHPPNYAYRHSAEAYNRRLDCASCHNTRVFCRDCHEQAGFGSEGRLNRGFHDAEPVWLLRHGQAARQTLESCASCHGQRDCMQCHSEVGSFRINPHGSGFDARRAQRRNPRVCFACHLSDPLGRSSP
jgi:hypothetical protein